MFYGIEISGGDFLKAVFIPLSVLSFIKDHCNNKVVNRVVNKVVSVL